MPSSHGLLELLNQPWAILPGKLVEMQAIYATHLRGEKIDIAGIEARLGRPLSNEQQAYSIQPGGIAVLAIEGVIAPKANLFTQISGGASAQMLGKQIESAIADPRVKGLVLQVDSPGGSVLGSPELAATVYELAGQKPIAAVSDGTMASAAYWIGAAANQVFISGPTVQVGSIGVVATHDYKPRRDGGQSVEIVAGRYKRIATDQAPLTAEGQAYLQAMVDHIYSVFVEAVAQYRGVGTQAVHDDMADGRVFVGQQAIDAGLVDGVSTVDALVEAMATDPQRFARRSGARSASKPSRAAAGVAAQDDPTIQPEGGLMPVTLEQIQAEAPELLATLRSEGATAERERIQAVRAQSLPGHDALIDTLAFDGRTTGPEAAVAVLNAERSIAAARRQALTDDTPDPLPADASATGNEPVAVPTMTPMQSAHALAQAIAVKQAAARASGRILSAVDALAQVTKES